MNRTSDRHPWLQGAAIVVLNAPRPWVAATSVLLPGYSTMSMTKLFGRPVPNRAQLDPPLVDRCTPTSEPTYRTGLAPRKSTAIALTGVFGKFPFTLVQLC